jgi:hypothetical protein
MRRVPSEPLAAIIKEVGAGVALADASERPLGASGLSGLGLSEPSGEGAARPVSGLTRSEECASIRQSSDVREQKPIRDFCSVRVRVVVQTRPVGYTNPSGRESMTHMSGEIRGSLVAAAGGGLLELRVIGGSSAIAAPTARYSTSSPGRATGYRSAASRRRL